MRWLPKNCLQNVLRPAVRIVPFYSSSSDDAFDLFIYRRANSTGVIEYISIRSVHVLGCNNTPLIRCMFPKIPLMLLESSGCLLFSKCSTGHDPRAVNIHTKKYVMKDKTTNPIVTNTRVFSSCLSTIIYFVKR